MRNILCEFIENPGFPLEFCDDREIFWQRIQSVGNLKYYRSNPEYDTHPYSGRFSVRIYES